MPLTIEYRMSWVAHRKHMLVLFWPERRSRKRRVQDRKDARFAELLKVSEISKENNIEQVGLWAMFERKGKDKDYIIGQDV